jgi:hypothetical protein
MCVNLPCVCVCACVHLPACVRICNLKLLHSQFSVCFYDRYVSVKEILLAGSVEHSNAEYVELDSPNRPLSSSSQDSVEDIEKQVSQGERS